MVNTFLYSVFGQGGGNKHRNNKPIARYRNRWLRALLDGGKVEAVVALGSLADGAWHSFLDSSAGAGVQVKYEPITHPTRPEATGGTGAAHAAAVKRMLENWNQALQSLHPLQHPDRAGPLEALWPDLQGEREGRDTRDRHATLGTGLDAPERRLGRPARLGKSEAGKHPRTCPERIPALASAALLRARTCYP
jgi:hypothetical protein